MRLRCLALLAVTAVICAAAPMEVLCERAYETALKRRILLAPNEFFTEELIRISRAFLSTIGHRRVAQLEIFTSREDAIGHVSSSHPGLWLWLRSYESEKRSKKNPFAALIFLNGAAVLKIRYSETRFARHVLLNHDPLLFVVDSSTCEILALDLVETADSLRDEEGDVRVEIFARVGGSPSVSVARAVLDHIARSAGVRSAWLYLRGDACFIDTQFVPMIYRFEADCPAATRAVYQRIPTVQCRYLGTIRCYEDKAQK